MRRKNVLIVGGGGREHALAWKVAQSPLLGRLYAAPGNAGIASVAECRPVPATDIDGVVTLAEELADLVIVGPEGPLADGLADALTARGIAVFGPSAAAARIESSKAYARELMARRGVPQPRFATFRVPDEALGYVDAL